MIRCISRSRAPPPLDLKQNQVKYHKVTGEEPGLELKKSSYSPRDIAEMLQISENLVYEKMKKAGVEFVLVDYWKRYPKKAFDKWY